MEESTTEEVPTSVEDETVSEESNKGARKEEIPSGTVVITTPANIVTQLMDIAEPLSHLKGLLEKRIQCNLSEHEIYLQNATKLDETKSLVEQGVNTDGMVQFSTQIISVKGLIPPRINIVDVVKPIIEPLETPQQVQVSESTVTSGTMVIDGSDQVTKWIVCNNYRDEQNAQGIPYDPKEWTIDQTAHWLQWAAAEFALMGEVESLTALKVSGEELCSWSREEFLSRLPKVEAVKLLWTHLQILLKGKSPKEEPIPEPTAAVFIQHPVLSDFGKKGLPRYLKNPRPNPTSEDRILPGNRTGNNGQIQLWQFLLELLTDIDAMDCIEWINDTGEFKLLDAEKVAKLWGARKNKHSMNYEKLSRALRYYYDGDMIAKVHGKRFVYKFVCDLKNLIGFNAGELNRLVKECKEKSGQRKPMSSASFTL